MPKRNRTTVDRNRVKRRLREVVRLHILPVSRGMDIVVRAREEAYTASFQDFRTELLDATQQLQRTLQQSLDS